MNQETTKQKISVPAHHVDPAEEIKKKKYTKKDLFSIRFRSGDKNLSKNIDKVVYGL